MSTSITSIVEALSAMSVPVGTGTVAYVRWRKNAEETRHQREQAATTAANKAAADARAEEKAMRDQLLKGKDEEIQRLNLMLQQEQAENSRLQGMLLNRPQGGGGPGGT